MSFQTAVFYVFAAILVFAALRVISARNPVHAALWLVLSFFTAAAIWLLLGAEFLAIALVLVYVGAVMVLFLFVVMMLDVNFDEMRRHFRSYLPVGAAVGALVLLEMVLVILAGAKAAGAPAAAASGNNTKALGRLIYVDYVYPFELAAVLLPLGSIGGENEQEEAASQIQYEFLPSPESILEEVVPTSFKVRLFKCFLDSAVSEQIARMVAMKSATENAGELIKQLSMQYNRARQGRITSELMDLIGGVEALK